MRRTTPGWCYDLATLSLIWAVLIALVWPVGDFAIIDDWVYALSVEQILRDGTFMLPSHSIANVVLQSYWGALFCLPFGFSYTALRISTIVLALFGLWAIYGMAREVGAPRRIALVAAASLGLAPLYFQLASSFMTDVPFVSLTAIALWCFVRGIEREDRRFILSAFAVALASILIRQFGLVLVGAFGLALVARSRASLRSIAILLATSALGVALHVGFQHWLQASGRMPMGAIKVGMAFGPGLDRVMITMSITGMLTILPYVGAMVAPLYVATGFGGARRLMADRPRLAWGTICALLFLQIAAVINRHFHFPDYGTQIAPWGLGPMMLHDGYMLFTNIPPALPDAIWIPVWGLGMIVIAAIGVDLAAAAADLTSRLWRRDPAAPPIDMAILAFVLVYGVLLTLMVIRPGMTDRYLPPLVPPLILLAVQRGRRLVHSRRAMIAAGVLLLATGWFSVAATHDFLAFMRARTAATDSLEAAGVARTSIDGGYEYNGRYLNSPEMYPNYYADHGLPLTKSWWWVHDDEYVIASGPVDGYYEQRSFPYDRWLTWNRSRIVILHRPPGSKGEATNLPRKPK